MMPFALTFVALVATSEPIELRQDALEAHQQAQRTRAKADYEFALKKYRAYLEVTPSEELGTIHFYIAEVLWDLKRFREAGTFYTKVVLLEPNGRYAFDAAYNAILAEQKRKKTKGHLKRLEVLTETYVDLDERTKAKAPDLNTVLVLRAVTLRELGRKREARATFQRIIDEYPGSTEAAQSEEQLKPRQ